MRRHWTLWSLDTILFAAIADAIFISAIPAIVGNFTAPLCAAKSFAIDVESWHAKNMRQNQKLWRSIGSAINAIVFMAVNVGNGWIHLPTKVLIL